MKILSITAGAAGMYCGSCLRDNALAIELIARGHDVTLVPVYTPTKTDEENISRRNILFGGISVYLQQHSALFRKLPRVLDRLWDSPRVIDAFAGRGVSPDARDLGDLTVSMLQGESGVLRKEFDKLIEWTRDEPVPDVINLPNSLVISMAAPLRRAFKRPVCVTLQGEELFISRLVPPHRERALALIREQVRDVDRFIAVSEYGADFMADMLSIPGERMSVVPLGINMTGYSKQERSADKPSVYRVGYFARISPEKGLYELAEAYVQLRHKMGASPARLEVAGYMAPDQKTYLERARQILVSAGLEGEWTYHGELDRAGKIAFLREIDVMSVPTTYDEPKGMSLLEAMASGVPVVQPRRGAFIEVVSKTGGGVLVEPGSVHALADGLHALYSHPEQRQALGQAAFDGVRKHYSITHSADRMIAAYELLGSGTASKGVA